MEPGKEEIQRRKRLGRRMKAARMAARLSQSAIAKKLGVSRGAPAQWETALNGISDENLAKWADICDVSLEWLATAGGEIPSFWSGRDQPVDEARRLSVIRFGKREPSGIRELDTRGGMGGGGVIESRLRADGTHVDAMKDEVWIFPQAFIRESLRAPAPRLLVLEVQGDSMLPTINPGERVVIDTGHKIPSPDGIYALRDRFDLVVVKRLQVHKDEPKVSIISDNPSHRTETVGLDEIHIVGRVVLGMRAF
ncbi:MAG TPA: S24 family peptidase [Pseudolabrys sp.]|nr:S24 family peptidase [Pseudolabrys sp.]